MAPGSKESSATVNAQATVVPFSRLRLQIDRMTDRDWMFPYASARGVVAERYSALLQTLRDIAEEGCRLYRHHAEEQAPRSTPVRAEYYHRLYLLGALRHTLTLLESTIALLDSGLTHGARVTARPLFEILVNTKHIVAHPNEPVAWQLFYSAMRDHLHSHRAALKAMDPAVFPAAAIERAQTQVARIEGEVRELAGPEVQDREVVRWAGKKLTFAALARMHGMEDDYLAVYKDFSWDTHGTLALFHSTRRTPEGAMVLRDAFDLQDTRFVALAAGRWALEILHLVAAAWQTTTRGDALGTRLVRAAEETVNPSLPEWSEWMALVREHEGPASASP